MINEHERFERAFDLFRMPEPSWERLVRRRDRKQRNKRIGAVVVALVLTAAALAVTAKAFLGGTPRPANLPDTPGAWSFVRLPQGQFSCCDSGMHAVVAGGAGLVTVGSSDGRRHSDGYYLDGPATVWFSTDGERWTHIVGAELGDGVIHDVTAGGPGLVAVGSYGGSTDQAHNGLKPDFRSAVVWTSPDGVSWTRLPDDPKVFGDAGIEAIATGARGIVAVGWRYGQSFPAAWFSADGETWTRASVPGVGMMRGVTAFKDEFVGIGGTSGKSIWTSRDGLTWKQVPTLPLLADVRLVSVTDGPNGLVAVGSADRNAAVLTSQDGIHWARVDPGEAAFVPPPPAEQHFWELIPASVTSAKDGYVAVGEAIRCPSDPGFLSCGVSEGSVWTSPDGQSWTRVRPSGTFDGADERPMVSIAAWGSRYAAVGTFGTMWISR